MWDWYNRYYEATRDSRAYAAFCARVFGRNFAQHGFSDMAQVDRLIEVLALAPGNRVLELGCGNGAMAAYISNATGAHITGIDFIPEAIRQAQVRTQGKKDRLAFEVGDIGHLAFAPGSFDALIAVDTLYFTDLDTTVAQMKALLAPGGQMGIFYAYGADPENPLATFPRENLPPERTPLGVALRNHGLAFRAWDFTADDYRHAQLKKRVIEEVHADIEAEGNIFLYENRRGEAEGVMAAIEAGAHARYLYHVLVAATA